MYHTWSIWAIFSPPPRGFFKSSLCPRFSISAWDGKIDGNHLVDLVLCILQKALKTKDFVFQMESFNNENIWKYHPKWLSWWNVEKNHPKIKSKLKKITFIDSFFSRGFISSKLFKGTIRIQWSVFSTAYVCYLRTQSMNDLFTYIGGSWVGRYRVRMAILPIRWSFETFFFLSLLGEMIQVWRAHIF